MLGGPTPAPKTAAPNSSSTSDGVTWTTLSSDKFTVTQFFCFAHSVVGTLNTMVSSTNLTTWTGLGSTIFSKEMNSIAYNGTDTYVAVGRGTNTVAYRYGGVWTGLGSTFFTAGYSAQWQNNKFYINLFSLNSLSNSYTKCASSPIFVHFAIEKSNTVHFHIL
jgi:hypothetical protein